MLSKKKLWEMQIAITREMIYWNESKFFRLKNTKSFSTMWKLQL